MTQQPLEISSNLWLFPYSKEKKLCDILNDIWEEVAIQIKRRDGKEPRFTYDDISLFRHSSNPPEKMLHAWKTDNVTFGDLLEVLKASKSERAVSFVKSLLTIQNEEDVSYKQDEFSFRVPYSIVKSWTNNFDEKHFIGSGGFAKVYKGNKKLHSVAVKLFLKMEEDQIKMFFNEIDTLLKYKHPHLLRILHYSNNDRPCIIYEYMENGSLYDHLLDKKKRPMFNLFERIRISEQIAQGLSYLHSQNIVHRDIKSSNILLNKSMDAKIGDFGTARLLPNISSSHMVTNIVIGTAIYMAPEYLRLREISSKIDMYSFGIVLAELIEGLPAFDEQREIKDILEVLENDNSSDSDGDSGKRLIFNELKALSLKLTCADKYERPTAPRAEVIIKECLSKLQTN